MILVVVVQLIGKVSGYASYYMEHQVTEQQARHAIQKAYNDTLKRKN